MDNSMSNKDVLVGAVAGFFLGLLLLSIAYNLKIYFPYQGTLLVVGVPLIWAIGIGISQFLARYIPFFNQLGKFVAAGVLNTALDFSVLNFVSRATGITAGVVVGWVNVPGFVIAVINGYLWQRLWVFPRLDAERHIFIDFPKFLVITIGGLLINSWVIILVTTYLPIPETVREEVWLNVAKVIATAFTLVWNFSGYKFVVFRK